MCIFLTKRKNFKNLYYFVLYFRLLVPAANRSSIMIMPDSLGERESGGRHLGAAIWIVFNQGECSLIGRDRLSVNYQDSLPKRLIIKFRFNDFRWIVEAHLCEVNVTLQTSTCVPQITPKWSLIWFDQRLKLFFNNRLSSTSSALQHMCWPLSWTSDVYRAKGHAS